MEKYLVRTVNHSRVEGIFVDVEKGEVKQEHFVRTYPIMLDDKKAKKALEKENTKEGRNIVVTSVETIKAKYRLSIELFMEYAEQINNEDMEENEDTEESETIEDTEKHVTKKQIKEVKNNTKDHEIESPFIT